MTNVTNSAINEALNQCQREVARNGLPEKKRAKAWLDALSVKSKRDNCEKTYEEYCNWRKRTIQPSSRFDQRVSGSSEILARRHRLDERTQRRRKKKKKKEEKKTELLNR